MKSIANLHNYPFTLPMLSEDIVEYHAARLLLLFKICGTDGKIDSLTKMAKLDFFVRYPKFFNSVCEYLNAPLFLGETAIESTMVRFHYGPWDHRYYQVLAYLESRGLININAKKRAYQISLTNEGFQIAEKLSGENYFDALIQQMSNVKNVLGKYSGSRLKELIYELFDKQIRTLSLDEVIE